LHSNQSKGENMRLIHSVKVLLCSSLLVLSGLAIAGKGATSSKSMSRGFSSSRSVPSISNTRPSNSSFGSFGSFSGLSKQSNSRSNAGGAFNRDLANRQAQANAMKNWDNNHKPSPTAAASGVPLPSNSSNNSVGNSTSNTGYQQRPIAASPQVISVPTAPSNGPSLGGIMTGMVLGHVLTQPRTVYANGNNNGQGNAGGKLEPITPEGEFKQSQIPVEGVPNESVEAAQSELQPNVVATPKTEIGKPVESEKSTGVLGWMLIVGVIATAVWYVRRRMRAVSQGNNHINTKPHYSL
jgi:hypothetical protein